VIRALVHLQGLGVAFALLYDDVVSKQSGGKPDSETEENKMSTDVKVAKQVVHDKIESQINTAAAKLDTLKARAETAKANAEIKAIADLLPKKLVMQQKLHDLKKSGEDRWEQAKADLEARVADFEKSVKAIESKLH
jgi:multidrug resistance efflux pump